MRRQRDARLALSTGSGKDMRGSRRANVTSIAGHC